MSSMFDSRRHEPVVVAPWTEAKVREVVADIALEATGTFSPKDLHTAHLMDELGERRSGSAHCFGAGGVLWA